MLPLVLYDIPSKLPGNEWSPNTAKTRFVLSYKNLPFETVWVEFPDIASKMKEIGASPNKGPDGSELYTVPVLSDPNTGALITDSSVIAEYLEQTYPEKPIFSHSSNGLINAFYAAFAGLLQPGFKFVILRLSQILNEPSAEYLIRTRQDGKWLMGDTFSYADILVACGLLCFKSIFREEEWKRICSWHGGKWEKLLVDVGKECNLA
ncbi:hypothetical protein BDN67DRAFT_963274 [Paxillus ammoniavirescens]|nr:hypothetical protein BDN67DRAFT_963274 [Paxillus ammoniavirescens]